ncbi:hypothetical protein ABKA04_005158 [Annulohypoxylon sp. FPYF3050]
MVHYKLRNVLAWEPDSQANAKYFSTIPWCAKVIENPTIKPYSADFPRRSEHGGVPVIDGFMHRERAILRHSSFLQHTDTGDIPNISKDGCTVIDLSQGCFPIHIDIFALGTDLHAYPRTIYGGILTLLADGVCGKAAYMHRDLEMPGYTAYTNVKFAKPVRTDKDGCATILVRSQVNQHRSSGAKIVINAQFEGPDGVIYAIAESMTIEKTVKGFSHL